QLQHGDVQVLTDDLVDLVELFVDLGKLLGPDHAFSAHRERLLAESSPSRSTASTPGSGLCAAAPPVGRVLRTSGFYALYSRAILSYTHRCTKSGQLPISESLTFCRPPY